MRVKKYNGKPYGVEFTAAERKAMNLEINRQIAEKDEKYKEDITLKGIAETIGITEQHLSRIFKEETGENLSCYLNRFRIDKAKELLENDVNIKYLYSEVGFKNYNYFFVAFKKNATSPSIRANQTYYKSIGASYV